MDRKKRIGFDMRMAGEGFGLGKYIIELAKALLERKSDFEYILFFDKNFNQSSYEYFSRIHSGCRLVSVKYYTLEEQIRMPKILKREKLDLVHFPNFNTPVIYSGKSIVTIHDLIHHRFPGKKKRNVLHRLAYRYIIKKTVRSAKKVIAVSNNTKNDIINLLGIKPEKIEVVYEGASKIFKEAVTKENLNLVLSKYNIDRPYVLAVSEWRKYKNLGFLVESFKKLDEELFNNYNLVICGKVDPNYPEIADSIFDEKKGSIIATGRISQSDLAVLYSGATCFVSPSLVEGFGLTYLEAQSSKVPVLASDIPVSREILNDSAKFFDPKNKQDFLEKLSEILLNKSVREHLVDKGMRNLERFSWQKAALETEKIYQEVLSK